MAGFLAVKAGNRVTSRSKMVGLSAEATCAWLADVSKVNVVAVESQETRDRTLNTNAIMMNSVVDVFPAGFSKEATTVVDNITVTRKVLDDGRIGKLMRRVEDLKISERTVDIL